MFSSKMNRRTMLKSGISTLAAAAVTAAPSIAAWKAPGETRIIFLLGDFYHNGVTQEYSWRRVLGPAGWRLMFAQSPHFVTPEVLAEADLFVLCRYATDTQDVNIALGWTPERFVEDRPTPAEFMTDEMEDAIVENVKRGMGLLSIHCSIWNPKKKNYLELLGVEKPIMHTKVQPARIQNLNRQHPITRGIEPFNIGDDEIFNAEMIPGETERLFTIKGEEEPIDAYGGWCRDAGKGRIVSLLPGHTQGPYMQKSYKEIMWRSAYWAMHKNIPVSNVQDGYK